LPASELSCPLFSLSMIFVMCGVYCMPSHF
jgi:hypothetical protein